MLKIRLQRFGRIKYPYYKIVITNNLCKRNGKKIDDCGYYDPIKKNLVINFPLVYKYIKNGAYPTDKVRYLLINFIKKLETN